MAKVPESSFIFWRNLFFVLLFSCVSVAFFIAYTPSVTTIKLVDGTESCPLSGSGRPTKPSTKIHKIFILSLQRSGSSWLSDMLNSHPDVRTESELLIKNTDSEVALYQIADNNYKKKYFPGKPAWKNLSKMDKDNTSAFKMMLSIFSCAHGEMCFKPKEDAEKEAEKFKMVNAERGGGGGGGEKREEYNNNEMNSKQEEVEEEKAALLSRDIHENNNDGDANKKEAAAAAPGSLIADDGGFELERMAEAWLGFKVQNGQRKLYQAAFDNIEALYSDKPFYWVHLQRNNTLDMYLSTARRRITGFSHCKEGKCDPSKFADIKLKIDTKDLIHTLDALNDHKAGCESWVSKRAKVITVIYEDLMRDAATLENDIKEDKPNEWRRLLRFLNLREFPLASIHQKINTETHRDIIENYDEVEAALKKSPRLHQYLADVV